MAFVNVLKFTKYSCGILVDQESWHLMRRKTYFSDNLHLLIPAQYSAKFKIQVVYGGAGHPGFHYSIIKKSESLISTFFSEDVPPEDVTVEAVARLVLKAFREVQSNRVESKLKFLYGITRNDLLQGFYLDGSEKISINQSKVKKHALEVIRLEESLGFGELCPENDICITGIDESGGYAGFTIKAKDGVLSTQSCGFECLGSGKFASAMCFAKVLNSLTLDQRREGSGKLVGLYTLLNSYLEASEHFGQAGGNAHIFILELMEEEQNLKVIEFSGNMSLSLIETVKACRECLIDPEIVNEILEKALAENISAFELEKIMFDNSNDPCKLEQFLRGYKVDQGVLCSCAELISLLKGKEV
jgi:hypothetical protein